MPTVLYFASQSRDMPLYLIIVVRTEVMNLPNFKLDLRAGSCQYLEQLLGDKST